MTLEDNKPEPRPQLTPRKYKENYGEFIGVGENGNLWVEACDVAELAKRFGHEVLPLRAGLVPLTLSGKHLDHYADLAGVSLPVSARCGKARFDNALLFTHRGISGPSILQISNYWEPGRELVLDLLPDRDAAQWLREQRELHPAAELRTVLSDALPKRLAQRLCEAFLGNDLMRRLEPQKLRDIGERLQHWPIVASGTEGYRTAEVTLGGVDTRGLNSTTMASKLQAGLYFIGEVVDVTGWLGGYNFQWAWASGHAAGEVA